MPYAHELPLALALLALVGLGMQPALELGGALRGFASAAWSGALSPSEAWTALRALLLSLCWLLCVPALAALIGLVGQRAPSLRWFAAAGDGGSQQEKRGRSARGRISHNLMIALKAGVLLGSVGVLLYDSVAGFLESFARSSSQLLAITQHALPALLLRAAWACLVLAVIELGVQQVERLRRLRMTRQQLQEEQRELVGDPRLLSEVRRRAQLADTPERMSAQLRAAALEQLGAAALLITSTSWVVALQYRAEQAVPVVLLSAEGALAVELLQRAYSLNLPLANDELLARALSRVAAGATVPPEHHARVAQLMLANAVPAALEAVS